MTRTGGKADQNILIVDPCLARLLWPPFMPGSGRTSYAVHLVTNHFCHFPRHGHRLSSQTEKQLWMPETLDGFSGKAAGLTTTAPKAIRGLRKEEDRANLKHLSSQTIFAALEDWIARLNFPLALSICHDLPVTGAGAGPPSLAIAATIPLEETTIEKVY